MSLPSTPGLLSRSAGPLRKHPVITLLMFGITILSALAGWIWLDGDWPAWRRLLAGAITGFGVGLIITMSRMLGAFTEDA